MKLRELIGEVVTVREDGYFNISKTEKGCFTNLEFTLDEGIDWLDAKVTIHDLYEEENGKAIELDYEGNILSLYGCLVDGNIKVISTTNGDEIGCTLFGDVFIPSGHDGSYMFNIKTGEFKDFS